jgi:hypothetical protein
MFQTRDFELQIKHWEQLYNNTCFCTFVILLCFFILLSRTPKLIKKRCKVVTINAHLKRSYNLSFATSLSPVYSEVAINARYKQCAEKNGMGPPKRGHHLLKHFQPPYGCIWKFEKIWVFPKPVILIDLNKNNDDKPSHWGVDDFQWQNQIFWIPNY